MIQGDITTSEVNGRVQSFEAEVPNLSVLLPSTLVVPDGGPIFVFRNLPGNPVDIRYSTNELIFTMAANTVIQIFMATIAGVKRWVVLG